MIDLITADDIEQTEEFFYEESSDDERENLITELSTTQPVMDALIDTVIDEIGDEHQDFFYESALLIWLNFQRKYGPLRELTVEEVQKVIATDSENLNSIVNSDGTVDVAKAMNELLEHPQSEMIGYVYAMIEDEFYPEDDEFDDDGIEEGDTDIVEEEITKAFEKEVEHQLETHDFENDDPEEEIISRALCLMVTMLNNAVDTPHLRIVK